MKGSREGWEIQIDATEELLLGGVDAGQEGVPGSPPGTTTLDVPTSEQSVF